MTNRPRHEIAIVAGADSGIGQATAKELTRKGEHAGADLHARAGLMVSRGQGA